MQILKNNDMFVNVPPPPPPAMAMEGGGNRGGSYEEEISTTSNSSPLRSPVLPDHPSVAQDESVVVPEVDNSPATQSTKPTPTATITQPQQQISKNCTYSHDVYKQCQSQLCNLPTPVLIAVIDRVFDVRAKSTLRFVCRRFRAIVDEEGDAWQSIDTLTVDQNQLELRSSAVDRPAFVFTKETLRENMGRLKGVVHAVFPRLRHLAHVRLVCKHDPSLVVMAAKILLRHGAATLRSIRLSLVLSCHDDWSPIRQLLHECQAELTLCHLHIHLLHSDTSDEFETQMRDVFQAIDACEALEEFGASLRVADILHSNKWTKLMALEAVREQPLQAYSFVNIDDFRIAALLSTDVLQRFEFLTRLHFGRCPAYHSVWRYVETMKVEARRQIETFTLMPQRWAMRQHQQLFILLIAKLPHIARVECIGLPSPAVDYDVQCLRSVVQLWMNRANNIDMVIRLEHTWMYTKQLLLYTDVMAPNSRIRRRAEALAEQCRGIENVAQSSVEGFAIGPRSNTLSFSVVVEADATIVKKTMRIDVRLSNFVLVDEAEGRRESGKTSIIDMEPASFDDERTHLVKHL